MSGYDGNYFGPGDTITRAQVAKVATLVGGIHTDEVEKVDAPSLRRRAACATTPAAIRSPIPSTSWRKRPRPDLVVGAAAEDGALDLQAQPPPSPGAACPDPGPHGPPAQGLPAADSRHERTSTGRPHGDSSFADVPEYAAADVALVASLGLMSGYSEQSFRPWSGAQRGAGGPGYEPLPGSAGSLWPAD